MEDYCRLLVTDIEVEYFVKNILKIKNTEEKREAINSIAAAERNKVSYRDYQTSIHKEYRDFEYRDDTIREALLLQILDDLKNLERLSSDDKIELRSGGAKPQTKPQSKKKAYYIIGPPASGKSGIANTIADATGSYILDSDYAKRKLPEYKNQIGGASLVHDESDELIFSRKDGNLIDFCIENSYNIVIPKIGHSLESIVKFCSTLQKIGYTLYLISVDLDREKAAMRAYNRYRKTQRYVPLSLIFDGYGNQPTLNYFKIKQQQQYADIFNGFAQISTDVAMGHDPILIEHKNLQNLTRIFGGEQYEKNTCKRKTATQNK